jgi:hypothetical protein
LDNNAPVDALPTALAAHRQSFNSLKKSLHEAQLEPADPIWPQLPDYANLIDSLNILTQHISSLSSCVGLQREMLTQQRLNKVVAILMQKNNPSTSTENTSSNSEDSNNHMNKGKQPINISSQNGNTTSCSNAKAHLDTQGEEELRIFLEGVGPVMRALSYTCKRTMTQMHRAITTGALIDANRLQSNLALALVHFNREKSIALRKLYGLFGRKKAWAKIKASIINQANNGGGGGGPPISASSNFDITKDQAVSESVFPVYFFLFSLQDFAYQLEKVIEQFNQLQMNRDRSWWTAIRERVKNYWPSK